MQLLGNKMKYLLFGHRGQLGIEFERFFQLNGIEYYGYDIDELDITSEKDVNNVISEIKPSIIINCSAYNQVDNAELIPAPAFAVNANAVKNIIKAAHSIGAFVVHYSSDYVFDGKKSTGLYVESDEVNPINQYGKSKLLGEQYLMDSGIDYLLFRLSWVYGDGTQNFIYKFLQWSENNNVLNIASDEVSVPTYTKTIVDITMKSIKKGITGLYHLANSGYASRYEWAKEILKLSGKNNVIYPVARESFNLPALRPYFSAMDSTSISQQLNIEIPEWQEALKSFLKKIKL
jgi:dTDP-4-dehydrorhamnose reductase